MRGLAAAAVWRSFEKLRAKLDIMQRLISFILAAGILLAAGARVLAASTPVPGLSTPVTGGLFGTNTAYTGVSANYVADDKYKLRVGDKVSFQILEDRDQPKSLTITDSGELEVPYIGRVPVTDKSCKQAAEELKQLLEKEYYYQATVILGLDQANRFLGRVYVWGQVKNQGAIDMAVNENLTAGKAILRAGGFGDFANKKKVKVVRDNPAPGSKKIIELNMLEILEQGKTEKDLLLQPNDSVIVDDRLINF